MNRPALAVVATLVAPAPLSQPLMAPTRDVAVTYAIAAPGAGRSGATLSERMRWDAAGRRYRVDPPTPGMWMVVNRAQHTLTLVRPAAREAVVLPELSSSAPLPAAGGKGFIRGGRRVVAGVACTNWRTTDRRGEAVVACFTADGVLLRASVGGFAVLTATAVHYGAQPLTLFAVPAGFRLLHPKPLPAPAAQASPLTQR